MNFIPTNYGGHTFRSIMEARWAVFFDYFGFHWDYEPNGFELDGNKYLPDFYIREFDVYVEVKYRNDAQTISLSKKFAAGHNIDIVICDGNPHNRPLLLLAGSDNRYHLGVDSKILWFYKKGEGLAYGAKDKSSRPEYLEAITKANSQRFGVLELKNMLGKARKKNAFALQNKLLELRDRHHIPQHEIEYIVRLIKELNVMTCMRAFQETYKNKIDGLQLEPDSGFKYNKGLDDLHWD